MYLSSGHYTINVSVSVSVRLTVRVLVPHFLPWAGVASARLTHAGDEQGGGGRERRVRFVRTFCVIYSFSFGHTQAAPIGDPSAQEPPPPSRSGL